MKTPEILDPVTLKEIYGISRRGQTYFGRVVYVGLIGLIMYQFWSQHVSANPFLSPSAYAELGRELFKQFVPLQMLMVTLAAVGAAADRVVREEKSGTLGLLLLTPLTAKRIALSKWKAAMAQAGSLILCGLPVVAVCVYLGSVGPWDLLWCFSVTVALAMLGAAFGLRASAVCSSVPRALGLGFLYFVGYSLAPLCLLFVAGVAAIFTAPFIHPIYSAGWILYGEAAKETAYSYAWIPSTIVSFFVARLIAGSVGSLIEKRVRSPKTTARADPGPPPTVIRTLRGKPVRLTREVYDADPLLWKELITRGGSRWSSELKSMFLVYALIFIALCWLFTRGTSLATFAFLGALFSMLALINGASLFAPDKEGRKMDMLLSSPVSSAAIVRSKLLAGLIAPESIRILLVAVLTAVGFSWWSPGGILLYMSVLLIFLLFVFALAAAASLHAESLQGAALASAGILCTILLVLPIFVSILAPSVGESRPPLIELLSVMNPVYVLEPLGGLDAAGSVGRAFGRFLLFSAVYLSAITGLSGLMLWRFDRIMGRVWSLFDWFRDPVTLKELSGSSRRWQTYASRMLYVGVIAAVLWNFSDELKARSFARSASEYAWLGRQVFLSFFALQLLIVSLSAVSAAADMVTREARSGTLGLMASTPLSPWRIAAGKWKAATAQAGFLVLCGGPVFGICVSIGAGGISQLLCVFILSLATAALSAAVALFFSTVFRTGVAAILVSIAALGVYTAAPIFLLRLHSSDEAFLLGAFVGHPLFGGLITITPGNLLARDPWLADYGWIGTASVSAVAVLLLLRWTASRIRTLSRRTPEPALLTRAFAAMDRFYESAGPARLRGIRLFADAGGVWDTRAVLWKELRVRSSGKLRNSVRISVAMLLVLTLVFFIDIDWMAPVGMMGGIGFLFMAFSNGAGLFVSEQEERKWDILLATPLSSWDIVASKLAAGLVPLAPVGAILLLFAVVTAWLFHISPADLGLSLTVLLLPILLSYTTAAACSLRASTLRGAFTTAFGVMTAFLVVLPILVHNCGSLLTGSHRRFAAAVLSPAPYLDILEAPLRWGHSYYGYPDSALPDAFPCFVVLYGGAVAGLVAYMKTRFDPIAGRS